MQVHVVAALSVVVYPEPGDKSLPVVRCCICAGEHVVPFAVLKHVLVAWKR